MNSFTKQFWSNGSSGSLLKLIYNNNLPENLTTHAALQDFKKRYLRHVNNLY